MNIDEKAHQTIAKLLHMTVKGEIDWSRFTDTRLLTYGTDDVVQVGYKTALADNYFAIYEVRYQTMDDGENVYWNDRIVLKIIDVEGMPVWEFPNSPQLRALLSKVQAQAAGVESKLDKILKL